MSAPLETPLKPGEFRIISSRRIPSLNPARRGQFDLFVTYVDQTGDRRLVTISKDHPTEADVVGAVKDELKELGQWQGKTYKL